MLFNKSFGVGSDIADGIYADVVREWVPVKNSDSHVMLLNNGFAVRAPGKMYAKVEVPSRLVSDLGFIPGYNIDGSGVKVEYFSRESILSFTTEKGTYILDGKKNPELYGEIRDFLLGDNVLLGTAGGMSMDMGGEEKGHGALYKGGVITLSALLMLGLSGCTGTSADTAKEKATEKTSTQQYGDAPSDPHIEDAYLGDAVNIVGDEKGLGFYIDQKNHKISPGAPAEMAGVIDVARGKGLVYMDMDASRYLQIVVSRSDGSEPIVQDTFLQDPLHNIEVLGDIKKAELDLVGLKQKHDLKKDDYIEVINIHGENNIGVKFVVQ